MNNKHLLFIEDLYDFYSNKYKRSTHFSAEKTGHQIFVQVPAEFEVEEDKYKDDTLLFCKAKLMHSGENRNHSNVTDEALQKAAKGLAYKPILANFTEYTDEKTGETLKDFTSHDMEIDDDGNVNYLEKQIGCFTADEPLFEVEEDTKHNFLYGYCAIPREYTDATAIIERKNGTKISVELAVNEMQYNAKNKVLELTDVIILGATCLGKDPITKRDVGEGMKNARLDIADFSSENNSLFSDYNSKMIELQDRLSKLESACFNNKEQNNVHISQKEGGNDMFEKLLEKYNITVEDVTFDYTDLSDEELEQKFAEVFGDDGDSSSNDNSGEPSDDNDNEGSSSNGDDNSEGGTENQDFVKITKEFEISHNDIRSALYNLLDAVEREDNDCYWITAIYDTYFVYESWTGKIFGQKYTKNNDVIEFDGERYSLHAEYLNDEEFEKLKEMRSNYSFIVDELNTYRAAEAYADKMTVFDDEAYADYLETEEFKALMSEENVNKYSKEELAEKADVTFAKIVKKNKSFSFSADNSKDDENKKKIKRMALNSERQDEDSYKPYGGLFDEKNRK